MPLSMPNADYKMDGILLRFNSKSHDPTMANKLLFTVWLQAVKWKDNKAGFSLISLTGFI